MTLINQYATTETVQTITLKCKLHQMNISFEWIIVQFTKFLQQSIARRGQGYQYLRTFVDNRARNIQKSSFQSLGAYWGFFLNGAERTLNSVNSANSKNLRNQ